MVPISLKMTACVIGFFVRRSWASRKVNLLEHTVYDAADGVTEECVIVQLGGRSALYLADELDLDVRTSSAFLLGVVSLIVLTVP